MSEIRSFEDLIVWRKAHGLFLEVVKDAEAFNSTTVARVIAGQILRSSSSISANIAEGFGRRIGKEHTHYLTIARGSTTETLDWYLKCRDLQFVGAEVFAARRATLEEILKMLNRMIAQQLSRRNQLSH